jgi:HK97 gp10 family phage protein
MVTYRENRAGIEALQRSPMVVQALAAKAQRIRRAAQFISPVDTGRYRASWRVRVGIRDGRAWAQVRNDAPYAVYLEFGTRYMRRQRVLGRAIDLAKD